jgi:hypothetical protein
LDVKDKAQVTFITQTPPFFLRGSFFVACPKRSLRGMFLVLGGCLPPKPPEDMQEASTALGYAAIQRYYSYLTSFILGVGWVLPKATN